MNDDDLNLPSGEELSKLPKNSIATYAIRCALRSQPMLITADKRLSDLVEYKNAVIELNRSFSRHYFTKAPSIFNTYDNVYIGAKLLAKLAEDVNDIEVHYAANAIELAIATSGALSKTDSIKAAGYAANFSARSKMAPNPDEAINYFSDFCDAAKEDYNLLESIDSEVSDASETGLLGDLWHESPPTWYVEARENYDLTIAKWRWDVEQEKEKFDSHKKENEAIIENEIPIEFYIDRGNSSKEIVQEVFDAISNLNFAAGGFGLQFKNDGNSISIVPEEVSNEF